MPAGAYAIGSYPGTRHLGVRSRSRRQISFVLPEHARRYESADLYDVRNRIVSCTHRSSGSKRRPILGIRSSCLLLISGPRTLPAWTPHAVLPSSPSRAGQRLTPRSSLDRSAFQPSLVHTISTAIPNGTLLLVDGTHGELIIEPITLINKPRRLFSRNHAQRAHAAW